MMFGEEMPGKTSGEMSEMSDELELLECYSLRDNQAAEVGD